MHVRHPYPKSFEPRGDFSQTANNTPLFRSHKQLPACTGASITPESVIVSQPRGSACVYLFSGPIASNQVRRSYADHISRCVLAAATDIPIYICSQAQCPPRFSSLCNLPFRPSLSHPQYRRHEIIHLVYHFPRHFIFLACPGRIGGAPDPGYYCHRFCMWKVRVLRMWR